MLFTLPSYCLMMLVCQEMPARYSIAVWYKARSIVQFVGCLTYEP